MEERWAPVPQYEGFYEVSTLGQVRSLPHLAKHSRKGYVKRRGKILAQHPDADGYLEVNLSKHGKVRQFRVHRLVCTAFLPNPDNLPVVNHKDFDKSNNCIYNLEWCSQKYNALHAVSNGRLPHISKEARCRISKAASESSRRPVVCSTTGHEFRSVKDACKHFNVTSDTVIRSAKKGVPTRSGLQFEYIIK